MVGILAVRLAPNDKQAGGRAHPPYLKFRTRTTFWLDSPRSALARFFSGASIKGKDARDPVQKYEEGWVQMPRRYRSR